MRRIAFLAEKNEADIRGLDKLEESLLMVKNSLEGDEAHYILTDTLSEIRSKKRDIKLRIRHKKEIITYGKAL